jgi:putative oxidoreductase
MKKINGIIERLHNPDIGILLVRLAVGIVFINAGWMKLQMTEFVVPSFASMGIPAFLAYFVIYAELIGGILLVLGVFVRYAAIVIAIIMAVATFMVHWQAGFSLSNGGYEYTFVLGLCAIAITTLGAGKYTVLRLVKKG